MYMMFDVRLNELNLVYLIHTNVAFWPFIYGCLSLAAATALSCICSSIMRCCGNAPTTPLLEHAAALSQRAEAEEAKKPALFYPMYTAPWHSWPTHAAEFSSQVQPSNMMQHARPREFVGTSDISNI